MLRSFFGKKAPLGGHKGPFLPKSEAQDLPKWSRKASKSDIENRSVVQEAPEEPFGRFWRNPCPLELGKPEGFEMSPFRGVFFPRKFHVAAAACPEGGFVLIP